MINDLVLQITRIDVGTEITVRMFFFVMQTMISVCLEENLSYFKMRLMLIIWLNSAIKAFSVEANPLETLIIISMAVSPMFNLFDEEVEKNRRQA